MEHSWLERIAPCIRPALPGESTISHTWHSEEPAHWVEPRRVIYDHELVLVSRGHFETEIAGYNYRCPEHSYLIIPPGYWHSSWASDDRGGHRHWVHFDWVWQGTYTETPVMTFHPAHPREQQYRHAPPFVPQRIFYGQITRPERVYDLSERLSRMQRYGSPHERLACRAVLLELLLELLDPINAAVPDSNAETDLGQRVRNLLEETVAQQRVLPSIQHLLSGLGYSYAHLCRVFHARYGIPPLKFIHALRISRAKSLLRDTELTIDEIAHRVGFDDPNYFRQLFKQFEGAPPSQYRKLR